MDLSNAFDTINHELVIAKLHAYGYSKDTSLIVLNSQSNRKERVTTILLSPGAQCAVTGPLLSNIYVNDFSLTLKNIDIIDGSQHSGKTWKIREKSGKIKR